MTGRNSRTYLGLLFVAWCTCYLFFFFQAEDGIRDYKVTGVQTCALPISGGPGMPDTVIPGIPATSPTVIPGTSGTPGTVCPGPPIVTSLPVAKDVHTKEIGRASCRERV